MTRTGRGIAQGEEKKEELVGSGSCRLPMTSGGGLRWKQHWGREAEGWPEGGTGGSQTRAMVSVGNGDAGL